MPIRREEVVGFPPTPLMVRRGEHFSESYTPTPGFLAPPEDFHLSATCPSTPPHALSSPQPRTPKPSRLLAPPRTPLAKLFTSFGGKPCSSEQLDRSALGNAASIARPDSACSNYSSSSNSSQDSTTTFTTAGGSCTSPETDTPVYFPSASSKPTDDDAPARPAEHEGDKGKRNTRVRSVEWTEEMDGHLWRAYSSYQQDPKITPFFVLPGQIPPLGVCYKVAREAKRTWKQARMEGGLRSPVVTPRVRSRRMLATPRTDSNRADALRKSSPYAWPVSQGCTRRRLRELCRRNYGLSRNPYHDHKQKRARPSAAVSAFLPSRASTLSPSPFRSSTSDRTTAHDAYLFSTRSMALSLTTSTASSMRPNGALASFAADNDVDAHMTAVTSDGTIDHTTERLGFPSNIEDDNDDEDDTRQSTPRAPRLGPELGSPFVDDRFGPTSSIPSTPSCKRYGPVLLPPLEVKSSSSPYGTWPRRLKRQEPTEGEEKEKKPEGSTLPPPTRRTRRGTIGDLFGESTAAAADPPVISAAAYPRTRARGYTIGVANSSGVNSRRRYRPSAPLLTVTGPVSYDSPELASPLAARDAAGGAGLLNPFSGGGSGSSGNSDLPETPKRLGSPFRLNWKGKNHHDNLETPKTSSVLFDEDEDQDYANGVFRSNPSSSLKFFAGAREQQQQQFFAAEKVETDITTPPRPGKRVRGRSFIG